MKQIIFTVLILSSFFANAQSPLGVGNHQLNIRLGLSNYGIPVQIGIDRGIHPDITAGLAVSVGVFNAPKHDKRLLGVSGNVNYHFDRVLNLPSPWNLYAGLNIGVYLPQSGLSLGAQLGTRYFVNDTWGFNLELGGGNVISSSQFGVTIKL